MLDLARAAIRGSTQDHLDTFDIADDLIILKDGSAVLVIETKAVNFALLSEREQEAIIYAYGGLLNSLNFSIQIVIRSKKKDISSYVASLEQQEQRQTNELLRNQIRKYREFISKTVKENNVLDKKFYICLPFSSLEMGITTSTKSVLGGQRSLPLSKEEIIKRATNGLVPRRDHILRQLGRLGLKSHPLTTHELVDLFYDIYNPNISKLEKLKVVGFDISAQTEIQKLPETQ